MFRFTFWGFLRDEVADYSLCFQGVISDKFRGRIILMHLDSRFLLRRSRPRALFLHQFFELGNIDSEPPFTRHELREIEWKSVCVVKLERELPRNGLFLRKACLCFLRVEHHNLTKPQDPLIKRFVK